MSSDEKPFPIDYGMWTTLWESYKFRRALIKGDPSRFPKQKNILADDIIGVFSTPRGDVELSEVTFPDFTGPGYRMEHRNRFIGITWPKSKGRDGKIVQTFAELDEELGLTPKRTCPQCGTEDMVHYMQLMQAGNELAHFCMECAEYLLRERAEEVRS